MNKNRCMTRSFFLPGLVIILTVIGLPGMITLSTAKEKTPQKALFAPAKQVGTIVDRSLSEASGLAASLREDNLFWVINDSGNPPVLFAMNAGGLVRARYTIADTPNCDWEDLAAFSLGKTPCLLIADVGDNLAGRAACNLYIVEEPELMDDPGQQEQSLPVKWRIQFCYPDGPRDCEAVAVDVDRQRVLLLSKRDRPPVLYALPLKPGPDEKQILRATVIGPVTSIPPPAPGDMKQPYGFSWSRPTAMDLSADGNRLIVLTYKNAYAFVRQPGQSWQTTISMPPAEIILPHPTTGLLPIREALCIHPKTGALFITGEKPPAPVFRLLPPDRRDSQG